MYDFVCTFLSSVCRKRLLLFYMRQRIREEIRLSKARRKRTLWNQFKGVLRILLTDYTVFLSEKHMFQDIERIFGDASQQT